MFEDEFKKIGVRHVVDIDFEFRDENRVRLEFVIPAKYAVGRLAQETIALNQGAVIVLQQNAGAAEKPIVQDAVGCWNAGRRIVDPRRQG